MTLEPAASPALGALLPGTSFIQIAYVVDSIDQAMARWHRLWGTGPYIVRRHIAMEQVWYRGTPATLDISAAFVQAGKIQIEFIEQHDDRPSAFRDMYAPGQQGIHHVAVLPEDARATVDHLVAQGYPVATELRTRGGRGAWFIDTRPVLGHMMEIYPESEGIRALYRRVATEAAQWDGRTMVIELDGAS